MLVTRMLMKRQLSGGDAAAGVLKNHCKHAGSGFSWDNNSRWCTGNTLNKASIGPVFDAGRILKDDGAAHQSCADLHARKKY